MRRNLEFVHQKELYGLKGLWVLYPELFSEEQRYSYLDIVNLYNLFVKLHDINALEVFLSKYNINEIIETVKNNPGREIGYNYVVTTQQKAASKGRLKHRGGKQMRIGSREYRTWFDKRNNDKVVMNSRRVIYQMKRNDVVNLLRIYDKDYKDNSSSTIIELYETLIAHDYKKDLIIYYVKNMLNNKFPIEETVMVESGEIEIV